MFLPEYFSKQWPIYLPYFWLVLAYAILIHSFVVNDIDIPQFIVIGIVIGLVILRQVLTFNDNERLHGQALKELKGRKRTEEELRQLNQNLDERVEQRTNELRIANDLLVVYNQKIEGSLREKEVLIKEIHHRVKNNLQTVSSLLSLQTRLVEDPAGRSALKDSQMRVRSMALIHEKLYQSDNLRDIDLRPYIENLCMVLFQSYQTDKRFIQLDTQVENLTIGIDVAIPLGLIINELISNALKHAFPGGRSGTIQMTLNSSLSGNMTLKCQDDGCGMPDSVDFSRSKSLGLQLVHNLTRQLDGKLEICSQNGLGVTISIPLQVVRDQKLPDRSETGELVL